MEHENYVHDYNLALIYIESYLNKNGEYPNPTPRTDKWLKQYLPLLNSMNEMSVEAKRIRQLKNKPKEIKYQYHELIVKIHEIYYGRYPYFKKRYRESIVAYLKKRKGFRELLTLRRAGLKDDLTKTGNLIREKVKIKEKFRGMKRDLLENSAKICMNPRRIMRLLEEDVISLDNIETLYDL